jgi:radical SAM family RiPP maturation amino acid epimerase
MEHQMEEQAQFPAAETKPLHPSIPHSKRFLEWWTTDPQFRERVLDDPQAAVCEFGLQVDVEKIRPLFEHSKAFDPNFQTEESLAYRDFMSRKIAMLPRLREAGTPSHPGFAAWRKRQIRRARWELGLERASGIVHAPMCVELSSGCTVKCWFCGIGALPFGGNLPYTEETRDLWRGVLAAMHELCGPAAGHGFCYWGTDPLDNPDYEKFMADFHEILGRWPQTTTAIPLRDVARTHALLSLVQKHNGFISRFSVLSRSIFERIMAEFSPEELLRVELIPQFSEEASPKAVAGAGRERALRQSAKKGLPAPPETEDGGTIACVSGFLFNMVERRVRLVSPCTASARYPLGYIVFHDFHFEDADDLRKKLAITCERYMPTEVPAQLPLRFHPHFKVEIPESGFVLVCKEIRLVYEKIEQGADLARRLMTGGKTASELADTRFRELGVQPARTFAALKQLYDQGLLADETPAFLDPSSPLVSIRSSASSSA